MSTNKVRVSIPSDKRIVDARNPYAPVTTAEPAHFGHMVVPQIGSVAYVTLDNGREVLVMREHLTEVPA